MNIKLSYNYNDDINIFNCILAYDAIVSTMLLPWIVAGLLTQSLGVVISQKSISFSAISNK